MRYPSWCRGGLIAFGLYAWMLSGCSDDPGSDCEAGEVGCPCRDDGSCGPTLVCLSDLCVGGQTADAVSATDSTDPTDDEPDAGSVGVGTSEVDAGTDACPGGPGCEPAAVARCADRPEPCPANATCVDSMEGSSCECDQDYALQGDTCTPLCDLAGCDANASCSIVMGEAQCSCTSPYIGDGQSCTFDSECAALDCDDNADCVVAGEQRDCECRAGYSGSGTECSDDDECADDDPCGANQTCTNTTGSYRCDCNDNPRCALGEGVYCDGVAEYACTLDGDGCLVDGPTTTCTAAACREASCTTGDGCGETLAAEGSDCGGDVCNADGDCVPCLNDGDCGGGQICIDEACVTPRCGDGVVTAPEPCDPLAGGTANDAFHCSAACEAMAIYVPCADMSDCEPELPEGSSCMDFGTGAQCYPWSGLPLDETGDPFLVCPQLSDPSYTQKLLSNIHCVIECNTPADCPEHLSTCSPSPFAGAGFYEAQRFCEP